MKPRLSIITMLPLLAFALLVFLFAERLGDPRAQGAVDSPLIGKHLPELPIPDTIQTSGKPYIVNVFASWCAPCAIEHPFLMDLKKQGFTIVGIAYKDTKKAIDAYLKRGGNPYAAVIHDSDGIMGITLGVTGVPESFAVDKTGIVRARQQAPFADEASVKTFTAGVSE